MDSDPFVFGVLSAVLLRLAARVVFVLDRRRGAETPAKPAGYDVEGDDRRDGRGMEDSDSYQATVSS